MKKTLWTDPIVDEIHRIREEMAREADYDIETLGRRLQESERRRQHDSAVSRERVEPYDGESK